MNLPVPMLTGLKTVVKLIKFHKLASWLIMVLIPTWDIPRFTEVGVCRAKTRNLGGPKRD